MMELLKNKKLIAIVVALLFLGLLLFIAESDRQPQNASEFTEEFGPATIINGEGLIRDIGLESFTYFREDVTFLARNEFEQYRENNEVVYEITDYTQEDKNVTVTGFYEEVDAEVMFSISLLGNGKITNTYKIDGESGTIALPSTSKDNLFIGSLPSKQDGFTVSYLETSETFYITFDRQVTQELLEDVRTFLSENLEEDIVSYQFSSLGEDTNGRIRSFDIISETYQD